ncbi:hypothetical protein TDB9533_04305 [Thalassocella blandensis]|nr:hypothetical protein TDB9533_04305 [Thalassocella blandensis]
MADSLRDFQRTFGRYLRDPENESLPEGIHSTRVKIYENLLFNNVQGFINTCFPVSRKMLEETVWVSLMRDFFREWRATSPYFHDIPHEFLLYLQNSNALEHLPPWFLELAHYEWVELAVDIADDEAQDSLNGDTNEGHILIACNPALQNMTYQWPVHKISPEYIPAAAENTFLVVYRNSAQKVEFSEINPATSIMITYLEQSMKSREDIVDYMHQVMPGYEKQQLQEFIDQIINQLLAQEILIEVGGGHAAD